MKRVSIIIPLHNAESFIEETLTSAIRQNYKNVEIIVVEKDSTDESLKIAQHFKSDQVRVYSPKELASCTASALRNYGLSKAGGDYVQYLDADDILSENKIGDQVRLLESGPEDAIATCGWGKFRNDISEAQFIEQAVWKEPNPLDWLIKSWGGGGMMTDNCWLTPRHIVEKAGIWNEKLTLHDDGEFFCRILLASKAILFSDTAKVYYRSGHDSLRRKSDRRAAESSLNVYRSYKAHILMYEDSQRVRKALLNKFLQFIYQFHPQYPDLLESARGEIFDLGFTDLPPFGGFYFKTLSKVIGFDRCLKLRAFLNLPKIASK